MTSTFSSFAPIMTSLESQLSSATANLAKATNGQQIYLYSRVINQIEASMTYISNKEVIATATDTAVVSSASSAFQAASSTLSSYYQDANYYGMNPSYGGNLALAVIMGIFFACHTILGIWARAWSFGITFICGTLLELIGYIGRVLSHNNGVLLNYYVMQSTCITLAPIFIMAGIYYLLAQIIVIYGPEYSVLKPLHYSAIFVSADVISLLVQGAGAGIASSDSSHNTGTYIIVGGLAFQVFSMTMYLAIFSIFLYRIKYWFPAQNSAMEAKFNPKFASIRRKKLFRIFPVVLLIGSLCVYVRCYYRVVELSEGWKGYLSTHEIYIFLLDAMMVFICIALFIPFHPGIVFAREMKINVRDETRRKTVDDIELHSAFSQAETNDNDKDHNVILNGEYDSQSVSR